MFRHRRLVKPGLFPVSMELNTSMDATWKTTTTTMTTGVGYLR